MSEPKRNADINSLWEPLVPRVETLMAAMKARGFDPVIFEARRSKQRQEWLYGFGRSHHLDHKPVTWTHQSRHIPGKAVDIISKGHGWNWPAFYKALREEAEKIPGLEVLNVEQCHVQWSG